MSEIEQYPVPEGFEALPEGLGFTDVLKPVYRRVRDGVATIGIHVQVQHTNMIGICHGGVIMTLADIGAAWGLHQMRDKATGAPTLNLGFDFISAAKEGDWIQAETDRVELKKRFGFSSGVVTTGEGRIICRFNGTFYFPDHDNYSRNNELIERVNGIGASD